MSIDQERVNAIFLDCLFKDGEDSANHVVGHGVVRDVGFHPERIKSHAAEIVAMLAELPDEFQTSFGGGSSFLNACIDRHGEQWTGLHQRIEQLFQLGQGIGKVRLCLPRALWSALPGGMPYFVVDDKVSQPA